MRNLRSQLTQQQRQIDDQLSATTFHANDLLNQVAQLNGTISNAEGNGSTANTLRDQRDAVISELASIMDVTVVDHGQQGVDILVGSTPVVLGTSVRAIDVKRTVTDGQVTVSVATTADGQNLDIRSGALGALLDSRSTAVAGTIDKLDRLASQLIFEVNKLHSTGVNASGLSATTGTLAFGASDRNLALNDPANQVTSGLPFAASNGGFTVNVRNKDTGAIESVRVNVDLDGITSTGVPGTGDDTSAADIAAAIGAIPGLTATFTPEGTLDIQAATGFDFSFSEDSSGAVALLGLNSYFKGSSSSDIAVREGLIADPGLLAAGRMVNGQFIENGTALEIAGLQSRELPGLNGKSLQGLWRESVQDVGGRASSALVEAQASAVVLDSLESQRAGISGVSIDEESINLLQFQRQYQAAAKVISTAQDLTDILLGII
jgi:flagellar hook-associated protein 1 FlgK